MEPTPPISQQNSCGRFFSGWRPQEPHNDEKITSNPKPSLSRGPAEEIAAASRLVAGLGNPKFLKEGGPMAHPSHETAPQRSRNSAPESVYQGDRDGKTPAPDPDDPAEAKVTPPTRGGGGDGNDEQSRRI